MSERQKLPIVRLAELARERGIRLIALQLPIVRAGVDYLDQNESYKHYSGVWRDFESETTRTWLRGLGITFFDLAHSPIGDDSQNFVDAYHPSNLGALRSMQILLRSPEFRNLLPAIDPSQIDGQIAGLLTDRHL